EIRHETIIRAEDRGAEGVATGGAVAAFELGDFAAGEAAAHRRHHRDDASVRLLVVMKIFCVGLLRVFAAVGLLERLYRWQYDAGSELPRDPPERLRAPGDSRCRKLLTCRFEFLPPPIGVLPLHIRESSIHL